MSNKKNSNLEEDEILEEEEEGPEDLDKMLMKMQTNFRTGNESASKYAPSPEESLREYEEFN